MHIKLIINYNFGFLILEVNKPKSQTKFNIQTYFPRSDKNKTLVNIINKALNIYYQRFITKLQLHVISFKLFNVMINQSLHLNPRRKYYPNIKIC